MEHPLNTYITADCIISALGFGTKENLNALREYRSGVTLQTDRRIADAPILAATIDSHRLATAASEAGLENCEYTQMEQLFILTIRDVLAQSGIRPDDETCGWILSTTKGNIDLLQGTTNESESSCSISDSRVYLWKMAARIHSYFNTPNQIEVVSNACISGVSALIVARRWIETGRYKRVIVAGGDVLSHFITSGFGSFKSISSNPCLPYDARRDGLNLGEACGAVLLDTKPNNRDIILSGGGISNDANHISGPSRTGDGLFFAIRQAMNEAGVRAEEVSFVNAHGTATIYNDEMECKAMHLAGLQNAPLNSLKPYFGHTLGASGIIETIVCLHELKSGLLFATLGYEKPGVSMPVSANALHRKLPMHCCVKTASGFGGCNAAIVLTLPGLRDKRITHCESIHKEPHPETVAFEATTTVSITECRLHWNDMPVALSLASDDTENCAPSFAAFIREAYKQLSESNRKFYKMDDLSKLGYVTAGYLLQGKSFHPERIGLIVANSSASLNTDLRHQHLIDRDGDAEASPAVFVYTLPNVLAGEICIRHKIQGESTFFIEETYDAEKLEQYARIVMRKNNLHACIVGWCELLGEAYKAEFKLIETTL